LGRPATPTAAPAPPSRSASAVMLSTRRQPSTTSRSAATNSGIVLLDRFVGPARKMLRSPCAKDVSGWHIVNRQDRGTGAAGTRVLGEAMVGPHARRIPPEVGAHGRSTSVWARGLPGESVSACLGSPGLRHRVQELALSWSSACDPPHQKTVFAMPDEGCISDLGGGTSTCRRFVRNGVEMPDQQATPPLSPHPRKTPGRRPTHTRPIPRQAAPGSRRSASSCHWLSSC
jgi:hypothetical protein